jgi:hypothetical protein
MQPLRLPFQMVSILTASALLCVSLPACKKHCEGDEPAFIMIAVPDSAAAGQPLSLEAIVGGNGCSERALLEHKLDGQMLRLKAEVHNVGCVCTDILRPFPVPFTITPPTPGTYLVRINQPDGTTDLDTLYVY